MRASRPLLVMSAPDIPASSIMTASYGARSTRPPNVEGAIGRRRFSLYVLLVVLAALPLVREDFVPTITPFAGLLVLAALGRGPRTHRPPLLFLLTLAGLAFLATFLHYGTINGLRAGGTLLICLAGLKLLETRHERDLGTILLLTLFLLATDLYFDQHPLATIYVFVVFILVLGIWIAEDITPEVPRDARSEGCAYRRAMRQALGLFLWTLPWALALFFFFPRLHGPLWGWGRRHAWVSGLSRSLGIGGIRSLTLSNRTVMLVRFEGPRPPAPRRYFRVYVFSHFDGLHWSPSPSSHVPATVRPVISGTGPVLVYRVDWRPSGRHALAVLGRPLLIPAGTWLSRAETLRSWAPLRRSFHYLIRADTEEPPPGSLSAQERARDVALPPGIDPRARRLARHWRRLDASPKALVVRALDYFHREPFYYTLHPPPLHGPDAIDTFLFDTRRGFCTDYATALAVLLRAAGVPTRVVTGYYAGEYDPLDGRVDFRGENAHAWDEVWWEGRWHRVDPTAAIARDRISSAALLALEGGDTVAGFALGRVAWLTRLGTYWQRLSALWDRDVLGYGPRLQSSLLQRLGWRLHGWRSWLPIVGAVLLLPPFVLWLTILLSERWRHDRREDRAWEALLERLGHLFPPPRAMSETPREYVERLTKLNPFLGRRLRPLVLLRARIVYEGHSTARELRRYRRLLSLLRRALRHEPLSPATGARAARQAGPGAGALPR